MEPQSNQGKVAIIGKIIKVFGAIIMPAIGGFFAFINNPEITKIIISKLPKELRQTPTVETTSKQAVIEYYELINQRKYESAWNTLTPTFKRKKAKNDFDYYKNIWNKVDYVKITSPPIIRGEEQAKEVKVDINLEYTMKDGAKLKDPKGVITLIRDNGKWLFNDKTE